MHHKLYDFWCKLKEREYYLSPYFIWKIGDNMDLVIAEKPSVAISIAKVIGATKKKDGYYEGNG